MGALPNLRRDSPRCQPLGARNANYLPTHCSLLAEGTPQNQAPLGRQSFHIPDDYQTKILEAHRTLQQAHEDVGGRRIKLQARLDRLAELFSWGDMPRDKYLREKDSVHRELQNLAPPEDRADVLARLAELLRSVASAWRVADQEQRNRIARQLFEEIWVEDKRVIAVRPRPELEPFFELSYEDWRNKFESSISTPLGVATSLSSDWTLSSCSPSSSWHATQAPGVSLGGTGKFLFVPEPPDSGTKVRCQSRSSAENAASCQFLN